MRDELLGSTGLYVSEPCFGAMIFGGSTFELDPRLNARITPSSAAVRAAHRALGELGHALLALTPSLMQRAQ
jgi:hypothetical protein